MKLLRNRKDGFVISFHENLEKHPDFEVFEAEPGEDVQPDNFLSESDLAEREARKAAKPAKPEKVK